MDGRGARGRLGRMGVSAGDGSVWVTRPADGVGELVRIDPETNAVVGEPIEVGPGPVSVVSGFGALWVTNTSPPSVVRVDPASGEVRTVAFSGQVAVGFDSLWAASDDQVVRADPETGQPIETFRIPRAAAVEAAEGIVWVLAYPESSSPSLFYPIKGTAALWEIDPTDNRIIGQPVQIDDLQPIALAAGEGAVWVANYDSATITRFGLVPCSDPDCISTTSPSVSTTQSTPSPSGGLYVHRTLRLPAVTVTPDHGPVGTRVHLEGDGFTDPYWQQVDRTHGGGYGVFLIGSAPGGCELIAGSEFSLRIEEDGHLVADFTVPGEGACFQMGRTEQVRPGKYAIGVGCHACEVAEFRVTEG